MIGFSLALMLIGAVLHFGSSFIADLFVEAAHTRQQNKIKIAESLGFPSEQPFADQVEADKLQAEQYRLLAKIIGVFIFHIGVLILLFT